MSPKSLLLEFYISIKITGVSLTCEERRTPAVDRVTHVLGGADDDGEYNHEYHRVSVVHPVDKVVVITRVDLGDLEYGGYQSVDDRGRRVSYSVWGDGLCSSIFKFEFNYI